MLEFLTNLSFFVGGYLACLVYALTSNRSAWAKEIENKMEAVLNRLHGLDVRLDRWEAEDESEEEAAAEPNVEKGEGA